MKARWEKRQPDSADKLLAERLEMLWRVFHTRVKKLDADDWAPSEDE